MFDLNWSQERRHVVFSFEDGWIIQCTSHLETYLRTSIYSDQTEVVLTERSPQRSGPGFVRQRQKRRESPCNARHRCCHSSNFIKLELTTRKWNKTRNASISFLSFAARAKGSGADYYVKRWEFQSGRLILSFLLLPEGHPNVETHDVEPHKCREE